MADISPILDAHIRTTMATPGHPSIKAFAAEIGLTVGQLTGYIYSRGIPVALRGARKRQTVRKPRAERKKSRKLRSVSDAEIIRISHEYTLADGAALLGISIGLLVDEKKRLGVEKWARLRRPRKSDPEAAGSRRALAAVSDDELRRVLGDNTGDAAASALGVSRATITIERKRLGIVRARKTGRVPFAGADPEEDVEEDIPVASKKRPRREYSDPEILEAFYDSENDAAVARTLGRDLAYVKSQAARLDIHSVTRTPRIADPIRQRQEMDDFMIRQAIKMGIWHLSPDGDVVKHRQGFDPSRERIHPGLLEEYERPIMRVPRPIRDPKIRRPTERVVMKKFNVGRPKILPPVDARETARLVEEAIDRGKLQKLQPGYARNA